jgi:hypothetical protein
MNGNGITIHPNPATEHLTVECDNAASPITSIAIYNITGKVVYSKQIDQPVSSSTYTINLSSFGEGIYFINISNDKYSVTEKVVKVE